MHCSLGPLLLLIFIVPSTTDAPSSLGSFAKSLIIHFEYQSRAKLVEESFEKVKKNIRVRSEYSQTALISSKKQLERLFAIRVKALQKLTSSAESSAAFYSTSYKDLKNVFSQNEAVCAKYTSLLNDSDVRQMSNSAQQTSGVHVNIESYKCDPKVIRDFEWTGSMLVEKTMTQNKREDELMGHQFIGTYSGLTRMYPRRHWLIEPPQITIDLFDPKFRSWFINSESSPKDIVFLIDYSGSVKGPTMHLIKITVMYILSTLSPNDYFYGVYFNSGFAPILLCPNITFLPATTSNKKLLFERLGEIEEKDQAHLTTALKFSIEALKGNFNSSDSLFSESRSGGHKLVMLFTDGLDEWPHGLLEEELRTRGNDLIRIFGFSMGYGTGQLPLLQWMACNTFASYSVIDSIMDVKPQSRAFLDFLSVAHGKALEGTKVENRRISWTNLYMEAQGLGPTITLSLPIITSPHGPWMGQRIAGVAGIDISIAELTNKLPKGEQLYGMIVDHNGILIYHPKLVLPKTEVHCVRRSACYDASQVRHRAGAGLRVQYGFSDQRVYRLVGLIDSIPTIDLMELEGNSLAVRSLRTHILDRNCTEEPIVEGDREFYCANLANSPFSIVIVNSADRQSLVYTENSDRVETVNSPLISYYLSRRDLCQWALDSLPANRRFDGLLSISNCDDDLSMTRAMVNSIKTWAESWYTQDLQVNISCNDMNFPKDFPSRYYVISFVHTRTQVIAYFPSCSVLPLKSITSKFDDELFEKDNTSDVQFSIRSDFIIAYRPIFDKYNNRLAVVGVQWRMDYLNDLFINWTKKKEDWIQCRKIDCLLVTRSGFVVASSTGRRPAHLANFDPQLFASLDINDMVSTTTWVDAQAECVAKRIAPWTSPAYSPRNPLKVLIDTVMVLLSKTFWVDIYYLISSFASAQPSMSGGICRFQRIKPVERCFLRYSKHRMTLNITKQIQLADMKCSRYARVFPVPQTTLTLIQADRACPGYKAKKSYYVKPQKLEGCAKVNYFKRRRPIPLLNISLIDEELPPDCLINSCSRISAHIFTLFMTYFIIEASYRLINLFRL